MKTPDIIRSEHQNLRAVLYSLEHLVGLVDDGRQADFSVFHGLLTYVDRFLDRYHHPKENDYLFPALLLRDPASGDLVKTLGRQHARGDRLFVEMLKLLSAWEFGGAAEYPPFREALLGYVKFEREHADLEEAEALPRAEAALTEEDWRHIDAAFGENRDPMFTPEWHTGFSALWDKLVNTLPAPLGLGDNWKTPTR